MENGLKRYLTRLVSFILGGVFVGCVMHYHYDETYFKHYEFHLNYAVPMTRAVESISLIQHIQDNELNKAVYLLEQHINVAQYTISDCPDCFDGVDSTENQVTEYQFTELKKSKVDP